MLTYLFFDVEGANCYNFISKMCTFGYVISDDQFNVLKKVDVILNPESPFDKHILREKMNAYDVDTYIHRPAFPYFYESIKHILEKEDQIIVGWSIENDVKYVYDACKRYRKTQIKYKYFDIQKVVEIRENLENSIKLETACINYNIKTLVTHKSDDDSLMTLEITKKVCEKEKCTLLELIKRYPQALCDVDNYAKRTMSNKEIAIKNNRRAVYTKMLFTTPTKNINSKYFNEQSLVFFSTGAIDAHYDSIKSAIRYICNTGAKFTKNFQECNIYVGTKLDIKRHQKNDAFQLKTAYEIKEFLELINKEEKIV